MRQNFQYGLRYLAAKGLNLVAILPVSELEEEVAASLAAAVNPLPADSRLLLVGHGGRTLWRAFQAAGGTSRGTDPLDRYSRDAVMQVLHQLWRLVPEQVTFLYPLTDWLVPLQQLGSAAGWAHRSPIGTDIHPDFGLWFAYRVAVLVDAPLPLLAQPQRPSPCDSCLDKPCIRGCPAGAVGDIGHFDLHPCLSHRLRPQSSCAHRCLARLACPVAPQHRYTAEQLTYHYGLSLETIRQWSTGREG